MVLLGAVAMIMLEGSLDVMAPRQWVIRQNLTDSYLTFEEAYANRVSFDELTADDSDWPIYDADSPPAGTVVEIGKAPGAVPITGTLIRMRVADANNIPDLGDPDYNNKLLLNPSKLETWKLQSILTYKVGGVDYVKTRTVVRSR